MRSQIIPLVLLLASFVFVGCPGRDDGPALDTSQTHVDTPSVPPQSLPVYTYEVVNTWAHDTSAFTEGLLYHDGFLYESTGLQGVSTLRKVEIETGRVVQKIDLSPDIFGEGLALFGDKLYQLSWQNQKGFVYDLKSFKLLRTFTFYGEGWGMTSDSSRLYMGDGSEFLRVLDPDSLRVQKTIGVYDGNRPIKEINELEWVKGEIFANVWKTEMIVRIDPATGKLLGVIDLRGILPEQDRSPQIDVLNGIAYDPATDRLWVTGKKWPRLFEIRLKPASRSLALR
jgi:glutaminyl-peptide cyclotransferase